MENVNNVHLVSPKFWVFGRPGKTFPRREINFTQRVFGRVEIQNINYGVVDGQKKQKNSEIETRLERHLRRTMTIIYSFLSY